MTTHYSHAVSVAKVQRNAVPVKATEAERLSWLGVSEYRKLVLAECEGYSSSPSVMRALIGECMKKVDLLSN